MQKFNVGDLVNFKPGRNNRPYTILHVHQAPNDERVWYVCAYRGDIPYVKTADELVLHTAAKQPVEEGLLRDLNLKPGDVVELVSFGEAGIAEKELLEYKGKKWTVDPEGRNVRFEGGGWNSIERTDWIYRVVSRKSNTKYGEWRLGQPSRDIAWKDIQTARDSDGEIVAYRVKVEPEVKPHTLYGEKFVWNSVCCPGDTHKITFNIIDGEPDCSSVKMEKL